MELENYVELLERKFTRHFQVEHDKSLCGENLELYCRCNMRMGRTLITKNDIIDCFETNEYVLVKSFDQLDTDDVLNFISCLEEFSKDYIHPSNEHRSSQVYGVMVCSNRETSDKLLQMIRRYRYEKVFKLYLYGFACIKLVLVNLRSNEVVTSRGAGRVKKVYLPTP